MSLTIKQVINSSDMKSFVNLPFEIYKNNNMWIPPIKADEMKVFSAKTNPAFEFCDSAFWLVYKNVKCVGRIGAIVNDEYNAKMNEKVGRVARAEFYDDAEVVDLLFSTAEKWLKDRGMVSVRGPLGFTNLDLQGLLVEGFDQLPSIGSVYHLPYYQTHFERVGYQKEIDWLEFRLTLAKEIPEKALKLKDIIKKRFGLQTKAFTKSKDLISYSDDVLNLLEKAFSDLHFVTNFTPALRKFYVEKYFKLLNPKFVKLVFSKENVLVGFIIGLPSLSEAMQKANGKIFPFGIFHILKALKKPQVVDLLLTGIDPQLQAQGISALLITELQQTMIDHNVRYVETTGIFEDNHKAIQHWKEYENIQHKRRRCFIKAL